jgi:hypothetical protein
MAYYRHELEGVKLLGLLLTWSAGQPLASQNGLA